MRKLLFLWLAVCALTGTAVAQHDKVFLLDYYQHTADSLREATAGLSESQLQFKPAPDRWSISQCLEHIVLTEKALFEYAKQALEQQPTPNRKDEVKVSDEGIIAGMTNRSYKAKASEELSPQEADNYHTAEAALADLEAQRATMVEYINGLSVDDMRDRVADSPFGPIDGYHSLLLVPAHTMRHTLQIEEVKADKGFPQN